MKVSMDGVDWDFRLERAVQSEDDERAAYLDGKVARRNGYDKGYNSYKSDNLRWAFNAGYNYQQHTESENLSL